MATYAWRKVKDTLGKFKSVKDKVKSGLANATINLVGIRDDLVDMEETSNAWFRLNTRILSEASTVELAIWFDEISAHFRNERWWKAALYAANDAVATMRLTPDAAPQNSTLAGLLRNLSMSLSRLGHIEAALEASEEAVALVRERAEEQSPAFDADLADSLDNLARTLSTLGRHDTAL